MDWVAILMLSIVFLLGFFIGIYFYRKNRLIGFLRFDNSMGDTYVFLETSEDLNNVQRKKYVVLKVSNENYLQ